MRFDTTPVLLIIALAAMGCASEDVSDAEAAAHEVVDATANRARALQRTAQQSLDEAGSELRELRARLEGPADEGGAEIEKTLAELTREYEELVSRVAGLTGEGGEGLERTRESLRRDLAELEYRLETARLEVRGSREEYIEFVAGRIDGLQAEIRALQAAASAKAQEMDGEFREGLQKAEASLRQLDRDLDALREASGEEFAEIRADISSRVAQLRSELGELELGIGF